MTLKDNYFSHTPVFWKKIGDSIFLLGTTLSATLAGMQVHFAWIISAIVLTWFGKTITNFFTVENT